MASFETITKTDGEEEIINTKEQVQESLSNIEKMNIRRYFEGKLTIGTKNLEQAINNIHEIETDIDGKKVKKLNMAALTDVFPKIRNLISLCEQEDSLESRNKNKERNLSKYNEFRETIEELKRQLIALETKVLVKENVALMDKAYVKGRFDQMVEGTYNQIKKIVDTIAPKN